MYSAYFAPQYSGAALQALTLSKELRARGHHVEFMTNRWNGLDQDDTVEGFRVRRVEPGRGTRHREFRLWFNMARYVWSRRHDFDILHSHGAYYTNAFIGPLARGLGLKSVIKASLANDDLHGLSASLTGKLHRIMLSRIDAYVAISRELVSEFVSGGMDATRVHHVPNGVDTVRFQRASTAERMALRSAKALPIDRPIALFVGVLDQRKNIQWLAEQWVKHSGFGTGAMLLAVGPQAREDIHGTLRQSLVELAAANPEHFMLHGFQTDVAAYYRCADLLVLPSAREGLPNVVLEAMASGLPCVAARTSGSKELILEGVTGRTFKPDSPDELARAVRACLCGDLARMGEAAWHLAQSRYSIPAIATAYESIYDRLMTAEVNHPVSATP
jgi:glycosyltransferase involved in cell wall biosynthesis